MPAFQWCRAAAAHVALAGSTQLRHREAQALQRGTQRGTLRGTQRSAGRYRSTHRGIDSTSSAHETWFYWPTLIHQRTEFQWWFRIRDLPVIPYDACMYNMLNFKTQAARSWNLRTPLKKKKTFQPDKDQSMISDTKAISAEIAPTSQSLHVRLSSDFFLLLNTCSSPLLSKWAQFRTSVALRPPNLSW